MRTWELRWHNRKSISIKFKGGALRKSVTSKVVQAVGFCVINRQFLNVVEVSTRRTNASCLDWGYTLILAP